MIGSFVMLVFTLIVCGVIWWALQQLIAMIPMGEPFATLVRVLMTVIMVFIVLYVIYQLLQMSGVMSMGGGLSRLH